MTPEPDDTNIGGTDSDTDSDPDLPPDPLELETGFEGTLQSESRQARLSKKETIMHDITEQMKLLFEVSALLKRPGLAGRYLRSNKPDSDTRKSQEFMPFDYNHVREKLTQWYDRWAAHNLEGYTGPLESSAIEIEVPNSLIRRLANANITRRIQLQYWRQHPDAPNSTPVFTGLKPGHDEQMQQPVMSDLGDATALQADRRIIAKSEAARTTNTKVSFSTAVLSEVNREDAHQDETAHTRYEESAAGDFRSTRVPPVPRVSERSDEFICPYCGLKLRSAWMKRRRTWKYTVALIQYSMSILLTQCTENMSSETCALMYARSPVV